MFFLLLRENHGQGLRLRVLFFEDPFLHAKIAMSLFWRHQSGQQKHTKKSQKTGLPEVFFWGMESHGNPRTKQKCFHQFWI